MLVRFRLRDALHAVTRSTVRKLARRLGVSDTEVVHYALASLRDRLLPAHPPDDGPLTAKKIRAIRKAVPQGGYHPTETILRTRHRTFAEALAAMPNAGQDDDFARRDAAGKLKWHGDLEAMRTDK